MNRITLALLASMIAAPASAQSLDGLLGSFQNKAKASAFDAAVASQVPGAKGLTDQLSDSQKAKLFDLGVDNAGTLGQAGAAIGVLGGVAGAATAQPQQAPAPAYAAPSTVYAQPAPTYAQPAPVYTQPAPATTYAAPAPAPQTYIQVEPTYLPAQ